MTTTEIIKKYSFIIIKPDGVTEKLYSSKQVPVAQEDLGFLTANRAEIIAEVKAIEKANDEKRAAANAENRRKERTYDNLWNDGGEGYNPHRDSAPGKFKVDTQD